MLRVLYRVDGTRPVLYPDESLVLHGPYTGESTVTTGGYDRILFHEDGSVRYENAEGITEYCNADGTGPAEHVDRSCTATGASFHATAMSGETSPAPSASAAPVKKASGKKAPPLCGRENRIKNLFPAIRTDVLNGGELYGHRSFPEHASCVKQGSKTRPEANAL